jgi:energy-coupling factor transporter transmembrane protein EcfT
MSEKEFLHRISPLAQLLVVVVLLIPVLLSFDPHTPLPFLLFALFQILVLGRARPVRAARVMLPLAVLPLGLFILNLLFSEAPEDAIIYGRFLFFTITSTGLHRAVVVGLRSLALIVISIGYLLVTDPLALVNALMQQVHLSPRIGFSLYVAWNTVPFLKNDLRRIQQIHRIRLRSSRRSFKNALPVAVTLLSGAIRHAERASVSMWIRGLDNAQNRTFIRPSRWHRRDTVYVSVASAVAAGVFALLIHLRLFVFGLG